MSSAPRKTNTQADEVAELRARDEPGDAEAQYDIGVMYSDGTSVPQDETQTIMWFRKAAEQGHADAQFCLGVMYEHGLGVPRDNAQARVWAEAFEQLRTK